MNLENKDLRLKINSDDFGLDQETNLAILESLQCGLINSTSFLVNFDDSFLHSLELYRTNKSLFSSVGIHLNLTEGKPLTARIVENSTFCYSSVFHGNFSALSQIYISSKNLRGVKDELEAQILKLLETGVLVTHIDSHHHMHTRLPILFIVIQLAKKYKINEIRLSRNIGKIKFYKRFFKFLANTLIRINGLAAQKYFGDLNDMSVHLRDKNLINFEEYEIMVHARNNGGLIVDLDGKELKEKLNKILPLN